MKLRLNEILPETTLERLHELHPRLPEGTKPAVPDPVSPYWRKVERIAKIRPAVRAAYNILRVPSAFHKGSVDAQNKGLA